MKPDQLSLLSVAKRISARDYPYESLKERGDDVLIARAVLEDGCSAIFKFWNRRGVCGELRRVTQTGTAYRERDALCLLRQNGLSVPEVYGLFRLRGVEARFTECLVEEDLGVCKDATEVLKAYIRAGDEAAVVQFEQELIRSTKVLVENRLLDTDHRLPNYVVTPAGHPVRLDFELAQRIRLPYLPVRQYGLMLGALIGSYLFAVQPDSARMDSFALRLLAELQPSEKVLQEATAEIRRMLIRQKRSVGIDTDFIPPWEK